MEIRLEAVLPSLLLAAWLAGASAGYAIGGTVLRRLTRGRNVSPMGVVAFQLSFVVVATIVSVIWAVTANYPAHMSLAEGLIAFAAIVPVWLPWRTLLRPICVAIDPERAEED